MNLTDYSHIHCIGIGGIGLSAIAEILLAKGYKVSGSDMKESNITENLQKAGAKIFIGHNAENVKGVDLLIYSAAVSMENPEILAAKAAGVPCISRAEALGALMAAYPTSIAVSGTHGKTTTTSMISLILRDAKKDPTILVGGILDELQGNSAIGKGGYFITEACEYMDSFLSLTPWMEVILNIDSDHLDYFKDIEHIVRSFDIFAKKVPANGVVVAFDGNPFVKSIIQNLGCRVVTFGFSESSDFYAKNIKFNNMGMPGFSLYQKGNFCCDVQLNVPGEHNVANALAAAAACTNLGVDMATIKSTLERFRGTQRRFDVIGKTQNGVTVIDDYAHHPTEIKATLAAAKNFPHNKIWCCFQPHTYTRTIALMDEFADAFADADKLLLAEIYAAREKNIYKMSSEKLQGKILEKHPEKDVMFISDFRSMAEYVAANAKPGDIVITMGAGDIYQVGELLLNK